MLSLWWLRYPIFLNALLNIKQVRVITFNKDLLSDVIRSPITKERVILVRFGSSICNIHCYDKELHLIKEVEEQLVSFNIRYIWNEKPLSTIIQETADGLVFSLSIEKKDLK